MAHNKGQIKWFSEDKGYGFITPDGGGDDLFVHHSGIKASSSSAKCLAEGEAVEFEVELAGDGRAMAVNVTGPGPGDANIQGATSISCTMGGSFVDEDWEFAFPNGARTVVLVGRTGNGKSATGNSILRAKKFKSMSSSSGVTSACELQTTVLEDGLTLNVIDTPGLFDFSAGPEFIGKEIVRCIDMAKDGIHAVLVVLSVRSRFSREEESAIMSLQKFFGHRIADYMVLVFTGGDDLEENEETLDDYLGRDCPEPLREILEKCGNRKVLFDNKSKAEVKRAEQLKELLLLVDEVVNINGGKPFADEIFAELKIFGHETNDAADEASTVTKEKPECKTDECEHEENRMPDLAPLAVSNLASNDTSTRPRSPSLELNREDPHDQMKSCSGGRLGLAELDKVLEDDTESKLAISSLQNRMNEARGLKFLATMGGSLGKGGPAIKRRGRGVHSSPYANPRNSFRKGSILRCF